MNAKSPTPDEINDDLRAQVGAEMPRPIGGFISADAEDEFNAAQDARFLQLCESHPGAEQDLHGLCPEAAARHTALPWMVTKSPAPVNRTILHIVAPYCHTRGSFIALMGNPTEGDAEANAELICRAVNSHAGLVAALQRITARLETVLPYVGATPSQIATHPDLCAARAALAKAGAL